MPKIQERIQEAERASPPSHLPSIKKEREREGGGRMKRKEKEREKGEERRGRRKEKGGKNEIGLHTKNRKLRPQNLFNFHYFHIFCISLGSDPLAAV